MPEVVNEFEAKSWRDGLKAYQKVREEPHFDTATSRPPRVHGCDIRAKENIFNPITQKLNNASDEITRTSQEGQERIAKMNNAWGKRLKAETKYNILTQEWKPGVDKASVMKPARTRNFGLGGTTSVYTHNIVSNLPFKIHHYSDPSTRPDEGPVLLGRPKKSYPVKEKQARKDINILSNKYLQDHERRAQDEWMTTKSELIDKYNRQRDYDPVRGRYVDDAKEKMFQDFIAEHKYDVVANYDKKMDQAVPSIANAESRAFNIITNETRDEAKVRVLDATIQAELETLQRSKSNGARFMDATRGQKEIVQGRTLHRNKHRRYEDEFSHGYNLLTTKSYMNEPPPPARTVPEATLWDVHQTETMRRSTSAPLTGSTLGASSLHSGTPIEASTNDALVSGRNNLSLKLNRNKPLADKIGSIMPPSFSQRSKARSGADRSPMHSNRITQDAMANPPQYGRRSPAPSARSNIPASPVALHQRAETAGAAQAKPSYQPPSAKPQTAPVAQQPTARSYAPSAHGSQPSARSIRTGGFTGRN